MCRPEVSVVVPVHRGWDHADRLLGALEDTDPRSVELIVVDDASADGRGPRFSARHPRVRLVTRTVNGGFAAAVNAGLAVAQGTTLAVVNSDAAVSPAALLKLAELAREDPQVIVGPRTCDPSGRTLVTSHALPRGPGFALEFLVPFTLLRDRLHERRQQRLIGRGRPAEVGYLVGSCLVFHASVPARIGPLDESYFMNSEEVDWQRRARAAGIRPVYVPGTVIEHDVGHGLNRQPDEALRRFLWAWEGRRIYLRSWCPRPVVAAVYAGLWASFVACLPLWAATALVQRRRRAPALAVIRRQWTVLRRWSSWSATAARPAAR